MIAPTPSRTQAERADQTRARILDAAVQEFSSNGLAGARTEQIAEAAGVNKALLYYYFNNKQALYDAALETVAQRVVASSLASMGTECSAGERLVHFALNHFDRIHTQRTFQSLMQQEMIRLRRGEENALEPLVDKVFRPMMGRVREVYAEGSASGELIQVDELQIMYAALGANVFYFLSAPVMGILTGKDPFDHGALEFRRRAAVEYLGKTIFMDREHGDRVAARVLAATPMPLPVETETNETEASRIESHTSDTLAKTHEVRQK
jgi:TetR/AcrR family transcriptional regulator